jgi:hypothetical protein
MSLCFLLIAAPTQGGRFARQHSLAAASEEDHSQGMLPYLTQEETRPGCRPGSRGNDRGLAYIRYGVAP